jgi:segregation and condensation protein B
MTLERPLLKRIVEAALFAAGQPLSLEKLGELFYEEERPGIDDFRAVLAEIEADYADRGVHLREVASGYRFQASHETGEWVSRLWEEKPQRYSRALLETLALIAYRQPITRGEVEDIRGVSVSSHIVKTLLEREWVRVLGYRDVPGRPAMYGTTKAFLDYFSLRSLEELPTLAEVRDLDKISAELDERMQQAQPQTSLPLETTVDAVAGEDVAIPAVEVVSDAPVASADKMPDTELPGAALSEAEIPEKELPEATLPELALPDTALPDTELSDAEMPAAGSVDSPVTEPRVEGINPTTKGAASEPVDAPASVNAQPTATPSLFTTMSSVLHKARSLFADTAAAPAPAAIDVKPVTPAAGDQAAGADEIPPSPIDPHDPRLN